MFAASAESTLDTNPHTDSDSAVDFDSDRQAPDPAEVRRGSDFAGLARKIKDANLLERRRGHYAARIALTGLAFAAAWLTFALLGDSWWQLVVAVAVAVLATQLAFLGHDGGHQQVFRSRRANDLMGIILGDLLVGLSYGWWLDKHNRHHSHPNYERLDPDIGDRVFAFTTNQVAARTGRLGRLVAGYQAWLFFPLLTLEGFHLHVASLRSLLSGKGRRYRSTELVLFTLHIVIYLAAVFIVLSPIKAVVFIVIHQAVFGLYMGCSFAPNHKGMPSFKADDKVDFLRRQVLTSRNVRGNWFTDLLLGGLNYQIEHHLFPNMPRPSLRHAQHLVIQYCRDHHISYTETTLLGSYVAAVSHLNQVGRPLRRPEPIPTR
ncbi:fatty acid desaturase family protein [Jatrophihabitans sp. DSM 45814]